MNVTITYNPDCREYRAPGPAKTEAQAYYTNDKQDAIDTCIAEHKRAGITLLPANIKIRTKRG